MRGKGEVGIGLPGRERASPKGKGKESRPGCCSLLFPFLLFFFFSTLKPFKQFYLISNKFEFKPYKLNARKIMLQHECTNKLIL
jgi:hypothetical protein